MSPIISIRLDDDLARDLDRLAAATGRSRSELVREALKRQVALGQFEELRRQLTPFAEARGLLTDDNVFGEIS